MLSEDIMSDTKMYLIRSDDGYYKIGLSKKPNQRIRGIQIGNPHSLKIVGIIDEMNDTIKERFESNTLTKFEWELHNRLDRFHVRGEWFKFDKGRQQNIVMFFNGRYGVDFFKIRNEIPDFDDWRDYLQ